MKGFNKAAARTGRLMSVALALAGCGQGLSDDPLGALDTSESPGEGGAVADTNTRSGGESNPENGSVGGQNGTGGNSATDAVEGGGGDAGESTRAESTHGGTPELELEPTGSSGCTLGSDCASGVCQPDVEGVLRCCEADCRALGGRVCSTAGRCQCPQERTEASGACLLRDGEPCRNAEGCASNHCVDGYCCNGSCAGVCERCDDPASLGTCALYAADTECTQQTGFACFERGRCRLPVGRTCGTDAECDSEHCEVSSSGAAICCDASCSGVCQRCASDGTCTEHPATDSRCPEVTCPADTRCRRYVAPAQHACSANGSCSSCEAIDSEAGIFCGAGQQCDGAGTCEFTGVGIVAAGARHTCAIRDDGAVVCWGNNESGQLGAAFDRLLVGDDESPADVPDLDIDFVREVLQLTAGRGHTCALFADGGVRCWGGVDPTLEGLGFTAEDVLGSPELSLNAEGFVDPLSMDDVHLPEPAVQIAAAPGGAHTCAVLASGNVACWGDNGLGQLGIGSIVHQGGGSNEPLQSVAFEDTPDVVEVRAGNAHTCARHRDGSVSCWGSGRFGQLGYGDTSTRLAPVGRVPIGAPALGLALGVRHSCARLVSGSVRCWGDNGHGELGYGHAVPIGDDETPLEAATLPGPPGRDVLGGDVPLGGTSGGENVAQIVDGAGRELNCVLFEAGAVRCWGRNDEGELGYGHNDEYAKEFTPQQAVTRPASLGTGRELGGDVALGSSAIALAEGGRCALTSARQLYCWGMDEHGELGLPQYFPDGSRTLTPVEMGPVTWE